MSKTIQKTNTQRQLIHNNDYFRYIFKKTEKIICGVFYVLADTQKGHISDMVIEDTQMSAQRLLESVLHSLRATEGNSDVDIHEVGYQCVELESKLRILNATHVLSTDLLVVFVGELDGVMRSLNTYRDEGAINPLFLDESGRSSVATESGARPQDRSRAKVGSMGTSGSGVPVLSGGQSRRERILEVLRGKGQSSIKDISDIIKDCSEKTIQRELNSLITDNIIVREGERRWSKYSAV